jgi:hypothetical protein
MLFKKKPRFGGARTQSEMPQNGDIKPYLFLKIIGGTPGPARGFGGWGDANPKGSDANPKGVRRDNAPTGRTFPIRAENRTPPRCGAEARLGLEPREEAPFPHPSRSISSWRSGEQARERDHDPGVESSN